MHVWFKRRQKSSIRDIEPEKQVEYKLSWSQSVSLSVSGLKIPKNNDS